MSKIHLLSDDELWKLEEKVRQAILGTDPQSRRLMNNFLDVIDAEKARRKNATQTRKMNGTA